MMHAIIAYLHAYFGVIAMELLVKSDRTNGLVMLLVDAAGGPLYGTKLKLTVWHLEAQATAQGIICRHCRRIHAAAFGHTGVTTCV